MTTSTRIMPTMTYMYFAVWRVIQTYPPLHSVFVYEVYHLSTLVCTVFFHPLLSFNCISQFLSNTPLSWRWSNLRLPIKKRHLLFPLVDHWHLLSMLKVNIFLNVLNAVLSRWGHTHDKPYVSFVIWLEIILYAKKSQSTKICYVA